MNFQSFGLDFHFVVFVWFYSLSLSYNKKFIRSNRNLTMFYSFILKSKKTSLFIYNLNKFIIKKKHKKIESCFIKERLTLLQRHVK